MSNIKNKKNKYISTGLLFLILAGFLFFGNCEKANAYLGDSIVNGSLEIVLDGEAYLLQATKTLFEYIVDAEQMTWIFGNPKIYDAWRLVRDMVNFVFILILIFIAFSTIFQVEKYNYKKLLLTLIIMALLVNFSFPIVRFIIDISNVLMYTIINNLFPDGGASGVFNSIADDAGLGKILANKDAKTSVLFVSVIFAFIFLITLFAITILLVIRAIALALLVIFSSLGFIAMILPDTSSYSKDYWDTLFKYALFGPVIMFMVYIATEIMTMNTTKLIDISEGNATDPNFVASLAFFFIPVVILWLGLGMAQKFGIAGAEEITKRAKNLAKRTGKQWSGYNWAKAQHDAYKGQRKKLADEKAKKSLGKKFGTGINKAQDIIHGGSYILPGSAAARKRRKKMREDEHREDIDKDAKKLAMGGDLKTITKSLNSAFNSVGAITTPADKNQAASAKAFNNKSSDDKKDYLESIMSNNGIVPTDLQNVLGNAASQPRVKSAVQNIISTTKPTTEEDLRRVASYITRENDKIMNSYVNS